MGGSNGGRDETRRSGVETKYVDILKRSSKHYNLKSSNRNVNSSGGIKNITSDAICGQTAVINNN